MDIPFSLYNVDTRYVMHTQSLSVFTQGHTLCDSHNSLRVFPQVNGVSTSLKFNAR